MAMELQVGVKVLLKNKEGNYLLLHRSHEKYPDVKDPWDIAGGRIDPGTPLLDNLAREVQEETKLQIQGVPKLLGAQDILRVPGRHVVRLTYTASVDGEPKLDEEHDSYRWLTLDEIRGLPDADGYLLEILKSGEF